MGSGAGWTLRSEPAPADDTDADVLGAGRPRTVLRTRAAHAGIFRAVFLGGGLVVTLTLFWVLQPLADGRVDWLMLAVCLWAALSSPLVYALVLRRVVAPHELLLNEEGFVHRVQGRRSAAATWPDVERVEISTGTTRVGNPPRAVAVLRIEGAGGSGVLLRTLYAPDLADGLAVLLQQYAGERFGGVAESATPL